MFCVSTALMCVLMGFSAMGRAPSSCIDDQRVVRAICDLPSTYWFIMAGSVGKGQPHEQDPLGLSKILCAYALKCSAHAYAREVAMLLFFCCSEVGRSRARTARSFLTRAFHSTLTHSLLWLVGTVLVRRRARRRCSNGGTFRVSQTCRSYE